jgi:hypothetical protein
MAMEEETQAKIAKGEKCGFGQWRLSFQHVLQKAHAKQGRGGIFN